jgi:hypothetical protein
VNALRILVGTFVHQVIRRHRMTHIIRFSDGVDREVTMRNAKLVESAWLKCDCGRLWSVK